MFDGIDPAPRLLLIDITQLGTWAPHVRPYLEKMAVHSGGRYIFIDILTAIAARNMQLWLVMHETDLLAVMVSEVISYPRLRALRMIGLVGKKPRVLRGLVCEVERIAKQDFRCHKIEAFHMPRFLALLPGFVTTHWFSEKTL